MTYTSPGAKLKSIKIGSLSSILLESFTSGSFSRNEKDSLEAEESGVEYKDTFVIKLTSHKTIKKNLKKRTLSKVKKKLQCIDINSSMICDGLTKPILKRDYVEKKSPEYKVRANDIHNTIVQ